MAQLDGIQRFYSNSPNSHNGITTSTSSPNKSVEQLIREDDDASQWSPGTAPTQTFKDPEEDFCHVPKKSILDLVRDKANRWRQFLVKKKKKQGETPSWGVSLDEYEDEDDPQYLGAPMYESEKAPEGIKENARQHPRSDPVIPENHALPNHPVPEANDKPTETNNKPVESWTEMPVAALASASAAVVDVTTAIAWKLHSLTILVHPATIQPAANTTEQKQDKGVSVKEFSREKLQPGEDETELSQVISGTISPTKSAASGGEVVENDKRSKVE